MMPNVHLRIDRLVLHGFGRVNRVRLQTAVVSELSRLLEAGPAPASHVPRLDAGTIHAAPGTSPEGLGVQIAQAIYGGIPR